MRNYLPFLGGVLLLLNSCSQSDDLATSGGQLCFGDEVRFSAPTTRVSDDQWQVDDRVGVYAGASTYNNIEYKLDDTNGTMSSEGDEKIYYLTDDEVAYYAYHPYRGSLSGTTYPIILTDQSDLSKIDLLWARSTSRDAEVEFLFEHKLSKIYFEVVNGDGADFVQGSEPTCSIYGLSAAADFNIVSGQVSTFYDAAIKNVKGTLSEDSKTMKYEFLLFPTAELSGLMLVVNASDSKKYLYMPSNDPDPITAWEAGLSYSYSTEILASSSADVYVENLELDVTENYDLVIEDEFQLTATYSPVYATETQLTWVSSDTDVATVTADGLVTLVGFGEATITVSAADGAGGTIEATCDVSSILSIGDYIYSDMSVSHTYNSNKTILGVIYLIGDDEKSGKAIYPRETTNVVWCNSDSSYATMATGVSTDIDATDVGIANMKVIYALDNDFSDFPAFAWVAALNSDISDYSAVADDATGVWYLPSTGEYVNEIYPIYWAEDIAAGTSSYTADSIVGDNMKSAGGVSFSGGTTPKYVTSTEPSANEAQYSSMSWRNNGSDEYVFSALAKSSSSANHHIRAVMNFDLSTDNQ